MRHIRAFGVGLLAMGLAALPMSAHAASYKHFSSAPLHFSIDYPPSWTIHYSAKQGYESFNQSNSAALTVNYHPRGHFTIKSFTTALIASYHKLGIKTTTPKYSGNKASLQGTGPLAGYKVVLAAFTLVDSHGAYSVAMAAPSKQFNQLVSTFTHMLNSFKSH